MAGAGVAMGGAIFAAALFLALGAVGVRALRRRVASLARQRALAAEPGRSQARPIAIASFDELDDVVALARCTCGGLLDRIGEAARPGVRVVRCTCATCEEDVDLYFDLGRLRH